jgi:hypothetical protein
MHAPKAFYQPEAQYSPEARRKQIDGKCLISMIVDASGLPQNVRLMRRSDDVFAQPSLTPATNYRFHPATAAHGDPVAVLIYVEVDFRIDGAREVVDPIRLGFATPPGVNSLVQDAKGVYPIIKDATVPTASPYSDQGSSEKAFLSEGKSACDIVLTIDAKGKASEPTVIHWDRESLGAPATQTLMASRYKPALLNGKPIPGESRYSSRIWRVPKNRLIRLPVLLHK